MTVSRDMMRTEVWLSKQHEDGGRMTLKVDIMRTKDDSESNTKMVEG